MTQATALQAMTVKPASHAAIMRRNFCRLGARAFGTCAALLLSLALATTAFGASRALDERAEIEALKRQNELLRSLVDELAKREAATEARLQPVSSAPGAANPPPAAAAADPPKPPAARASAAAGPFKNTPTEWYANLDLSFDYATKGMPSGARRYPTAPVGTLGWQPSVVTNNSYFGLRGFHTLGDTARMVFQLEAGVQVSAIPGTSNNNASTDTAVNGALFSRNNYLGLVSDSWGAVKLGRTDAPYKLSTMRMNPFTASIGDYASIMGNTGGDNRVEFGTRLSHALWYESPNLHGVRFVALVSPGQNRGIDNSIQATGEPDCTGGNALNNIFQPGGPSRPGTACNDGAFGTAYSVSLSFEQGPLYATAAYELHKDVNRNGDQYAVNFGNDNGANGNSSNTNLAAYGPASDTNPFGVTDEAALKAGVQYAFATGTTAAFIFEHLTRSMVASLQRFNERQRNGTWLALTQRLTPRDQLSLGWAHAGRTPGDPGGGFSSADPTGAGGVPIANGANMLALSYRHARDGQAAWYAVYARQFNQQAAHYDLGAGGTSGLTIDCHDGVTIVGANCYQGGAIQGLQVGLFYKF